MRLTNAPMDIITRLNEGDSGAFSEVYREFHKAIVYFARKMTESREEAEDIAQTTLSLVWQHRGHYESFEKLKAFIYITANNKCLDYLRKRKSKKAEHKILAYLAEKEDNVDNRIVKADVLRSLFNHADSLPTKQKTVFKMLFRDDMTFPEIQQALKMSASNVRMHKSLALKSLRAFLERNNLLSLLPALAPAAAILISRLPF